MTQLRVLDSPEPGVLGWITWLVADCCDGQAFGVEAGHGGRGKSEGGDSKFRHTASDGAASQKKSDRFAPRDRSVDRYPLR